MNMIKSKSLEINKSSIINKRRNSDSFLYKIIIEENLLNNNNKKLKLSKSFCFDSSIGLICNNSIKNKNEKLFEKCKNCNKDMYIITNKYSNEYCSYYCYKEKKLDNDKYYNITCGCCKTQFKTLNWLTDYCSEKCFKKISN